MLTVKNTFKLFDVINNHFHNDNDSRLFISEIEEIMDNKVDLKMNDFATRKDLEEHRAATKQDYTELRSELKQDISELRTELKQDISELRLELKQDISDLRTEFKQDMSELRSGLKQDMSELRSELKGNFNKLDASLNLSLANYATIQERTQKEHLKWMMGFVIGVMGLAIAIIKFI